MLLLNTCRVPNITKRAFCAGLHLVLTSALWSKSHYPLLQVQGGKTPNGHSLPFALTAWLRPPRRACHGCFLGLPHCHLHHFFSLFFCFIHQIWHPARLSSCALSHPGQVNDFLLSPGLYTGLGLLSLGLSNAGPASAVTFASGFPWPWKLNLAAFVCAVWPSEVS